MQNSSKKIYVAEMPGSSDGIRQNLVTILSKAGFEVVPDASLHSPETYKAGIQQADCVVQIVGSDSGKLDNGQSAARIQFELAHQKVQENKQFKFFVWYPPMLVDQPKDPEHEDLINEIRYSITSNMIFSTIASPINLADDIRSILDEKEEEAFDISAADVFLVFNEIDEFEAEDIVDMLSDIVDVEKLNIVQSGEMDYSEFCAQQIGKSKLAAVYFKETADWAINFTQQIWKKVGGASSHTPILLIGDEDPETNMGKGFKAPKVISLIVAGELIPLEIKVQLDKVAGNA